jgi:hypothetical protein
MTGMALGWIGYNGIRRRRQKTVALGKFGGPICLHVAIDQFADLDSFRGRHLAGSHAGEHSREVLGSNVPAACPFHKGEFYFAPKVALVPNFEGPKIRPKIQENSINSPAASTSCLPVS